jgi:hypothetical protein
MRPRTLRRYLCVIATLLCPFAASSSPQDDPPGVRLLNANEGLTLVSTALEQKDEARRKPDCSHLVNQIYELSGFPYPYASSYDLYAGINSFRRVSTPRQGDLVVWRGHVGIIMDPFEHTFYSSVSSGLRTESYDDPFWRAQGHPRFYRYVLAGSAEFTATNSSEPVNNSKVQSTSHRVPVRKEIADAPTLASDIPTKIEPHAIPSSSIRPLKRRSTFPSRIMVVAAANRPTGEEVGDAISEFNSSSGNLLRDWPGADPERMVVVYDQLNVERIELKRERGWVDVEVEGRLSIGSKGLERKRNREKQRWELRHTPEGWQLLVPTNRTYMPRDVAVHVLAGQLAFLTQNGVTSDDLDNSVRQQKIIVRALGFLFDPS